MTIREARPADVPVILQLIHDLAIYEKEPDAVKNTVESLEDALFGGRRSVFAHVAEEHLHHDGIADEGESIFERLLALTRR